MIFFIQFSALFWAGTAENSSTRGTHFLFWFLFLFFPVLCPVVRALPKTQAHVAEASDRL